MKIIKYAIMVLFLIIFMYLFFNLFSNKGTKEVILSEETEKVDFYRDNNHKYTNLVELDKNDTIRARYHLLRIYLDMADAENARKLLDTYQEDKHCSFIYTRVLIEHISLLLKEKAIIKKQY